MLGEEQVVLEKDVSNVMTKIILMIYNDVNEMTGEINQSYTSMHMQACVHMHTHTHMHARTHPPIHACKKHP